MALNQLKTISKYTDRSLERFGENGEAVVLRFSHDELEKRWGELCEKGCSWDHAGYKPHITISYDASDLDLDEVEPFTGEIVLGPEVFEEIEEDWRDKISEKVLKAVETTTDSNLGLVFGWAMVTAEKNDSGAYEPYFDLQGDHIPDHTMIESGMNFMLGERAHKAMHDGDEIGKVVFMFPLSAEVAEAYSIETQKTGLLIAVKPNSPEFLAKYASGEWTGFSIGGKRIIDEEVD